MTINPLLEAQKERSGATTYSKYQYQYHWALHKAIDEHTKGNYYIIICELHEDVLIGDANDAKKVRFKFNQIKTNKGKFTPNKLTKTDKYGHSPLGKLIQNCTNRTFSERIDEINFISVNGFSLDVKKGLKLEKTPIAELEKTSIDVIKTNLKKEGILKIPTTINFVIPSLSEKSFREAVIGEIAELINDLYPNSYSNAKAIYQTLIDDLSRKGSKPFDYEEWDTAVEKKGLTSETVQSVINRFTRDKNDSKVNEEFDKICDEIGVKYLESKKLKRAFNRYKTNATGNHSTSQVNITSSLKAQLSEQINKSVDLKTIITESMNGLSKDIIKKFTGQTELKAAVIFELINLDTTNGS